VTDSESKPKTRAAPRDPQRSTGPQAADDVVQVEKHDYTALTPANAPRRQPMQGFDPEYADIVDYIVRCTHRIWDERDVGLIDTHYTHNCIVNYTLGASHTREQVVEGTIQRLAEFPERRGMAYQVIWNGNDRDGFYTSHLVCGSGLHLGPGPWGAPTGKRFVAWTIADCMIFENKIYREWIVRDSMGMILQLGLDGDAIARAMAEAHVGMKAEDIGTSERALGQTPPRESCDTSIASSDMEADIIRALHAIWNRRMFGGVRKLYSERATVTIPCNRKLYGPGQIVGHVIDIMAMMPDAEFACDHIATVPASIEGGMKVAVRWSLRGRHKGYGRLGAPTGKPLYMLGMTHMHIVDGKIVEEFMLYDELALKAQTYLPR